MTTTLSTEAYAELTAILAGIPSCPKHRTHNYLVESFSGLRYSGGDAREALNMLLTLDPDDDGQWGYVVAEGEPIDGSQTWPNCFSAAQRIENAAIMSDLPRGTD